MVKGSSFEFIRDMYDVDDQNRECSSLKGKSKMCQKLSRSQRFTQTLKLS